MPEPVISLLRIRVINRFDAGNSEVTNDLPHLHQTHIEVVAMQPGNPGSSALGSWTCQLFPPGTEGYAAAKAIYDKLDYFQRVEVYISHDGKSLGKLYYAGIITGIRKGYGQNPTFELSGVSDIGLANLSKPFPGEVLSNMGGGGEVLQFRNFLGTNELGWADTFGLGTFSASNYTSTNLPGLTSGTWTQTTTDGIGDISISTGSGAVFLAKTGAIANSGGARQMVEVSGWLTTSSVSTTNAGRIGVGFSTSNANCNQAHMVYVTIKQNASGRYDADVTPASASGGVLTTGTPITSAFTSVDDPDGNMYFTLSLYHAVPVGSTGEQAAAVVNGKSLTSLAWPNSLTTSNVTLYPFLLFETPNSGNSQGFFVNLVQMARVTDDGPTPGIAAFKEGAVTGSVSHSLPAGTDPGPTFLEVWTRAATRQGSYWRYTPQAYVVGTRTLGTVDYGPNPGTDLSQSVRFSRLDGNLVDLQLSANADQFVSGTAAASSPTTDGGGIGYWRDIGSMTKYGVLEDQVLVVTAPNFSELRQASSNISSNRVNLSTAGAKTAIVLRDALTADKWRELDKVMIHDPEIGINYLVARVIAYTFDEGQATQTLTLDQFSVDDPTVPLKRLQQGAFQMGAKFNTR